MDRIRFGAAYHAEYQRHPDLEADFDLTAKARLSVIRVGESVWPTWNQTTDGLASTGIARRIPAGVAIR